MDRINSSSELRPGPQHQGFSIGHNPPAMSRRFLLLRVLAIIFVASFRMSVSAVGWDLPSNGFSLLRALQQGPSDLVSDEGRALYGTAIAAQGFIWGVFDVLYHENTICVQEQVSNRDVNVAVRAFLEQNTDMLSQEAGALTRAGLIRAFPCSK